MTGELRVVGDDGGPARCARCGAEAAGPCARCRAPVCGDCVTLTEGGARVWAICLPCARRGGRSLVAGWAAVLVWLLVPLVILGIVVTLLATLGR